MAHHRTDNVFRFPDVFEHAVTSPNRRQPFGGQDHLRAYDQGGYITVKLHKPHPFPFDRDLVQQIVKPVQFFVHVAHC